MNDTPKLYASVERSTTFRHLRERFALGKKSVLDIGCGLGAYLRLFGPGSAGVTASDLEIAHLAKEGLKGLYADAEDAKFDPGRYQAIWCNNLLEHLRAPFPFLERLRGWLTPDGMLILGVPVVPRLRPLIRLSKFRGAYASLHINFFTIDTLLETVRRAGWRVVEARPFKLAWPPLDRLLNLIAPHVYVIAVPDAEFRAPPKRQKEIDDLARVHQQI
jgi:SAM-dependent methyltransferase